MKTLEIAQCASLFAVDEMFISYICNRLNIDTLNIPFENLGAILEEVLIYKEQYSFLGEFERHSDNEECFCFELSYTTNEKRGNAWRVLSVSINNIHPFNTYHIKGIKIEGKDTIERCEVFRYENFCKDYFYESIYRAEGTQLTYYILIPVSAIHKTPPVFNAIVKNNYLYYLEYGKPYDITIIQSRKYIDLAKHSSKGYCILNKEGYQITRYYLDLQISNDGSIWATNGMNSWDKHYAYYNQLGLIQATPRFDFFGAFSEGLCPIGYDYFCGKAMWGFIDNEGNTVIDAYYKSIDLENGFLWGICKVYQKEGYGYINKYGNAVTCTGKLIASIKGETYRFAKLVNNKYISETGQIFSLEGEDLGISITKEFISGRFGFYKAQTSEGLVGYLNEQFDVVIPLIYADISHIWSGITKAITPQGKMVFLNTNNQVQNMTLCDFENIIESDRKTLRDKVSSSNPNRYRIYNISFTDWNGLKKLYQTQAKSKDEAVDNFWHSGVKFGVHIDSVD